LLDFSCIHCRKFQALGSLVDALGLSLSCLLSLLFNEHFIPLILIVDSPRGGGGARFAVYYGCAIWHEKWLFARLLLNWV
jgi:hypothetical protein